MKIVWKVSEKPTGLYSSFQQRCWPTASFESNDGWPAAFLYCDDDYRPKQVRTGEHGPITISVCHHQHPERGNSWKVFRLKAKGKTLDEAKALVDEFFKQHPDWLPLKPRD